MDLVLNSWPVVIMDLVLKSWSVVIMDLVLNNCLYIFQVEQLVLYSVHIHYFNLVFL